MKINYEDKTLIENVFKILQDKMSLYGIKVIDLYYYLIYKNVFFDFSLKTLVNQWSTMKVKGYGLSLKRINILYEYIDQLIEDKYWVNKECNNLKNYIKGFCKDKKISNNEIYDLFIEYIMKNNIYPKLFMADTNFLKRLTKLNSEFGKIKYSTYIRLKYIKEILNNLLYERENKERN